MNNLNPETRYLAIAVDTQNDFCPGGSLAVPNGNEVIDPLNNIVRTVKQLGGRAIFTRDWHPEQTSHFESWPVHCVTGTYGAQLHSDLLVNPSDIIINKGVGRDEDGYSGFDGLSTQGETIEDIIRDELTYGDRLVVGIGGLATDYCVKATVLDALKLKATIAATQMDVFAVNDAIRAVNINPNDGKDAMRAMVDAGAIQVTEHQFTSGLENGNLGQ